MKWWKSILIVVAICAVIITGVVGCFLWKVGEQAEKLEGAMQQYVTMNVDEQNQYVLSHMEEFMAVIPKTKDATEWNGIVDAMQNDPEMRKAATEWGRSTCAKFLLDMESVTKNLSPEEKAKYEQEAAQWEERGDRLDAIVKASGKAGLDKSKSGK